MSPNRTEIMEGMKIAFPRKSTLLNACFHVGFRVYLTLRKARMKASANPENGRFK